MIRSRYLDISPRYGLVHYRTPGGEHAVHAAHAAACRMLDSALRVFYVSVERALISDDVQRRWRLMHLEDSSIDLHVFFYYYIRGMEDACKDFRKLLLTQLTQRFGSLPRAATTRIQAANEHLLWQWGERLLSAASLDDVFDKQALS